jgi:hypothetical protein
MVWDSDVDSETVVMVWDSDVDSETVVMVWDSDMEVSVVDSVMGDSDMEVSDVVSVMEVSWESETVVWVLTLTTLTMLVLSLAGTNATLIGLEIVDLSHPDTEIVISQLA